VRESVVRHTTPVEQFGHAALERMQRQSFVRDIADLSPKVYYRLTDNWLELSARFVVEEHGIRELKDAFGREVLDRFDEVGIGIASATVEIVGLPPLRVVERSAGLARS
jgi:DNA-binding PadR family transcriptional regulator